MVAESIKVIDEFSIRQDTVVQILVGASQEMDVFGKFSARLENDDDASDDLEVCIFP